MHKNLHNFLLNSESRNNLKTREMLSVQPLTEKFSTASRIGCRLWKGSRFGENYHNSQPFIRPFFSIMEISIRIHLTMKEEFACS